MSINNSQSDINELKAKNKRNLEAGISIARKINLPELMKNDGYKLKSCGSDQFEVVDGRKIGNVFLDKKTGTWIHLPVGGKAENPISYAMREKGLGFPEAVRYLAPQTADLETLKGGGQKFRPTETVIDAAKKETTVNNELVIISMTPSTAEHEQKCRAYCEKRGISKETIDLALESGALDFGVSNNDTDVSYDRPGVRFIGYDSSGEIRNVETRLLTDKRVCRTEVGSDRAFSPVIPGSNQTHIVEGGFDALALIDLCKRNNVDRPTIIISGGGSVRKFLDNQEIKSTLMKSEKIIVWAENESNEKKQIETDKNHGFQREAMIERGITAEIKILKPKGGFKDLAEKNLEEKKQTAALKSGEEVTIKSSEKEMAVSM
ncbi:hypothetical protein [Methylicorpusculum sp.]|uniref:hypothetical protein n=1 Tax=Methylicorpusculum sp. TaxID=2713644 RepID=UPI002ABB3D28|nr:hypothetical protein [Methylicorpusculum sp.]MDZ4153998.1 hypothetical protein [Methylicorpusculum sp.]